MYCTTKDVWSSESKKYSISAIWRWFRWRTSRSKSETSWNPTHCHAGRIDPWIERINFYVHFHYKFQSSWADELEDFFRRVMKNKMAEIVVRVGEIHVAIYCHWSIFGFDQGFHQFPCCSCCRPMIMRVAPKRILRPRRRKADIMRYRFQTIIASLSSSDRRFSGGMMLRLRWEDVNYKIQPRILIINGKKRWYAAGGVNWWNRFSRNASKITRNASDA